MPKPLKDMTALFLSVAEWDDSRELIAKYIPSFRGSGKTLDEWLAVLPEDELAADPWLLYGRGLCLAPGNPGAAQSFFEQALQVFLDRKMAEGIFAAWAGLVAAIIRGSEDWRRLDACLGCLCTFLREPRLSPSPKTGMLVSVCRFLSLMLRPQSAADVAEGKQNVLLIEERAGIQARLAICLSLSVYGAWTGNYRDVATLIAKLRQDIPKDCDPLTAVKLYLMEALLYLSALECDRCRAAVAAGFKIAEQKGLEEVIYAFLACRAENAMIGGSAQEMADALAALDEARDNSLENIQYHTLSLWQCLLKRSIGYAHEQLAYLEKHVFALGSSYHQSLWHIGKAQVILAQPAGHDDALTHMEAALDIAQRLDSHTVKFAGLLYQAQAYFSLGKDGEAFARLEAALAVGKKGGCLHFPLWNPPVIAALCVKALEKDIEADYVRKLIGKRSLKPAAPPIHLETWPRPLNIRTLGAFEISLHGAPVSNLQKKPMELLKTLIACGGKEVPADRLAATLWPEKAGDLDRLSFRTTLHRLRNLLNDPEALHSKPGYLSLDPEHCWTDAQAFEYLCSECGELERTSHKKGAEQRSAEERLLWLLEKAARLYKGSFLPGDSDLSCITKKRVKLQDMFHHIVMLLGGLCEKKGQGEKAIAWYRYGLENGGSPEEFRQRIMRLYRQ